MYNIPRQQVCNGDSAQVMIQDGLFRDDKVERIIQGFTNVVLNSRYSRKLLIMDSKCHMKLFLEAAWITKSGRYRAAAVFSFVFPNILALQLVECVCQNVGLIYSHAKHASPLHTPTYHIHTPTHPLPTYSILRIVKTNIQQSIFCKKKGVKF